MFWLSHFDVPPAPDLRRSTRLHAAAPSVRVVTTRSPGGQTGSISPPLRRSDKLSRWLKTTTGKSLKTFRNTGRSAIALHALFAVQESGGSGTPEHIFFFYGDQYLGTDTSEPSEGIDIKWATSETVAVQYTIWRKADPHCCATGGPSVVKFHWTGSKLVPLDPIPSLSARY